MPGERVVGPSVVGAAELNLQFGVFGCEAGLECEGGEDHFGAHAVACLIANAGLDVEVADDRALQLVFRHELARVHALGEQGAPAVFALDAGRPVAKLGVDALGVQLDGLSDV